ncbi:MAG: ATP-binding protein [Desulfobacterales bacterium]|jgi:two-component system NtrC family sensor kinase|nr:ATP-binding protein [Desulfobacterales bacterium]
MKTTIKSQPHDSAFYHALTRKMVIIMVLVSFTPLLLISGLILEQYNRSYREKVHAHLGELVEKHCQNIDGFLTEHLNLLRFLVNSHPFEQFRDETFLEIKLAQLQLQFHGVFEDLGVVDDQGVQIDYAGPFKLMQANYKNADWFKKAIISPYFISDVFLGLRALPHFIIAVRQEYKGRVWILRATVDFRAFNTLVENLRIGETGFAFILNKAEEFQTKPPLGFFTEKDHYALFLNDTATEKQRVKIFEKKNAAGKENLCVGAFLKNGDWLLIYQQNTADAYRDLNHARKVALLIILIGGIVIITTAIWIARRMVARIASADREKNMMNKQVIETGKLAAIGELAAGIAHEINNPVAIMMEKAGWIQDLLEEEDLKDCQNLTEFQNSLEEIRNQARRCKVITHKLLSFARKTDSRPQPVQLNDLLEEVVGLSEQRAKYAGVSFHKKFFANLSTIEASPTEMQQVFLNLINNALDAMDNKGGSIEISTRQHKDHVTVAVADTGPGMPAANLEKIFQPFFTTKPVGKGTGLGLAICYGIIKKIGGHIEVESEIGKGTTFYLHFPVEKTVQPENIQQIQGE